MRPENQQMKEYLLSNGIDAIPKYISCGSMRGSWRLYGKRKGKFVKWWDNFELMGKLHKLGFRDYDGEPLDNFSGNGGLFQIFATKE